MARKHTLEEVLRSLGRKKDIRITSNSIQVLRGSAEVGNGSWGRIDYLCKVHGYTHMQVNKF